MTSDRTMWTGLAATVVLASLIVGAGVSEPGTMVLALALGAIVALAGGIVARTRGAWLWPTIIAAYLVKLGGSAARLWVLQSLYEGSGDATGYYNRGLALADLWRSGTVPALTQAGGGSTGTKIVSIIAGLLFAPHEPTMQGGFFIFATVAFLGQILLLVAYYRSRAPHPRAYAIAVLFLPSLVFWPSSVGKESLMLFFIGLVAYGAVRLLGSYGLYPLLPLGLGLVGAALLRPHIAALLAGSLAVALLTVRAPMVIGAQARRILLLAVAGVGVVVLATLAFRTFGVAPSAQEIDPFLTDLQRRTTQGGSAVSGSAIRSVAQVPAGIARVLFRPFPTEAHNPQAFLSSIEGALLLGLTLWRLPRLITGLRDIRTRPYLLFSLVYTAAFSVAFSAIFNLGILARERTQVVPFLLALLVGLGWKSQTDDSEQQPGVVTA